MEKLVIVLIAADPCIVNHLLPLTSELYTYKHTHTLLRHKPGSTPRFYRARTVPYALKTKVEQELDRLEQQGAVLADN